MSSEKEREVEPGCLGIIFLAVILSALWGISAQVGRVADALEKLTPKVEETKR